MRLDPGHPASYLEPVLEANYVLGRYPDAVSAYEKWRDTPPHVRAEAAACYAQLGDHDNVRKAVEQFESERPDDFDFEGYVDSLMRYHARQADRDHWLDGFRKAGLIT